MEGCEDQDDGLRGLRRDPGGARHQERLRDRGQRVHGRARHLRARRDQIHLRAA